MALGSKAAFQIADDLPVSADKTNQAEFIKLANQRQHLVFLSWCAE
jgi:hypothetical protein